MRKVALFFALTRCLCALAPACLVAQEAPKGSITIDAIADIKYPTELSWSPDSKSVAFLWDAAGKQDLYVSQGGGEPVALTDFPIDPEIYTSDIGHVEWASADQIIFAKDGALWTVSLSTRMPARLPGFQGVTVFSLSHDRKQMAYIKSGQVWVSSLAGKTDRQVTRIADGSRLAGPIFSLDDQYIAFSLSFGTELPEPMPYNGNRMEVLRTRTFGTRLGIVSVFYGDPVILPTSGGAGQWVAGPALVHEEYTGDRKTRQIEVTSVTGETKTIWKDYDPRWISLADGPRTVASPDGKMIAFISDRSGWAHLYVTPFDATSETQAKELGKGDFGDGYANWSPDSKSIVFAHSAPGNQQERFLSIVDVASGTVRPVAGDRGVNRDAAFSPDGAKLAYFRAAVEHPQEVYVVGVAEGSKPVRLTDSLPSSIKVSDLTAPVAVHYPSREDGKPVPATLMVSKTLDKSVKHPAIIWIHGSGADQNYLAWHPGAYRMYYSICQYFAQQGYVILTPDYRGSSGFSRDWTTGAFHDLGGGETQDVNAGADYLKTLSYVDPDRIGVWGLSYGGFMTLQSIIRAPKLFNCAIDVAGVGDWETWTTGGALLGRLGSTPVTDPEFYDRSAPVKHLDKIQRPLMILQGLNDANVPLWETIKVIDRLEKLGTPFDMAFYPGEIHFFRRAFVLRDAWRRADAFFYQNLVAAKNPPKSTDTADIDVSSPLSGPATSQGK